MDQFLCDHPEGLVLVSGDFNPTSTGITELSTKRVTGLTRIIKVLTRDTGTLDWCLTNRSKLMASPEQLPRLGESDHYSVFIHPAQSPTASKNTKKTIEKRDLRPSRLREFGQWIVQHSWEDVLSTSLVHDKYNLFMNRLGAAVDTFLQLSHFAFPCRINLGSLQKSKPLFSIVNDVCTSLGRTLQGLKRLVMQSNESASSVRSHFTIGRLLSSNIQTSNDGETKLRAWEV